MQRRGSNLMWAVALTFSVAGCGTGHGRGGPNGGPDTTPIDGGFADIDGGTGDPGNGGEFVQDLAMKTCPSYAKTDPRAFAAAMDLCGPEVLSASFNSNAAGQAHDVRSRLGLYVPITGPTFAGMSTGILSDENDTFGVGAGTDVQPGTDFSITDPNPLPMNINNGCQSTQDPSTVNDYVEFKVVVQVPMWANSFSFDFNFMSAEYPEFVGSAYNDKFLVLLDSKAFKGNISFDKNHNPITVNAGFFDVCTSAKVCMDTKMNNCTKPVSQLNKTGFEKITQDLDQTTFSFVTEPMGGGTGWLHTTSPVMPGETATLRFIIFDEGDGVLDSTAIIDNFQWQGDMSMGPTTIQ